jgi:hypothetical protein
MKAKFKVLSRLLLLGLLAIMLRSEVSAQDFCAVTATISDSAGRPIYRTWVQLEDSEGRVVFRTQSGPLLEICDFGFGPHTLRVGTNTCLPVAISNLTVTLGYPIRLAVVLNSCPLYPVPGNYCPAMLRVVARNGNPIGGVLIHAGFLKAPIVADGYGRADLRISRGTSQEITISHPDFRSKTLRLTCSGIESLDQQIVLDPQ